jgi:saccharopepsin
MFPSNTLLSIVIIALSVVDASPLRREAASTLGFTARVNARASNLNIADADRARAQAMLFSSFSKRASGSFSIASAVTAYTAQVGVGSPATQCKTCHRVTSDIFD